MTKEEQNNLCTMLTSGNNDDYALAEDILRSGCSTTPLGETFTVVDRAYVHVRALALGSRGRLHFISQMNKLDKLKKFVWEWYSLKRVGKLGNISEL